MKIITDKNIPQVETAFSQFGDVVAVEKKEITADSAKDADILLVRSEVKVNEALLKDSKVQFVATPTAGIDHVDTEYLFSRNIGFAHAPGCNSNSVAEYVDAALLVLSIRKGFSLKGQTIGVVGVGNVGSKVVKKAQALGMEVLQNDPPKARETGDSVYLPLKNLMDVDFLTLHVPLTKTGADATFHLIDENRLSQLKPGCILFNSARGSVVDSVSLKKYILNKRLNAVLLDVWEGEPDIDLELLKLVDIATPHIAGYSFDGKLKGTQQIYEAACKFLNESPTWIPDLGDPDINPEINWENETELSLEQKLLAYVKKFYDIEKDDQDLRHLLTGNMSNVGDYFLSLRRKYRIRREFHTRELQISAKNQTLQNILEGLGFLITKQE